MSKRYEAIVNVRGDIASRLFQQFGEHKFRKYQSGAVYTDRSDPFDDLDIKFPLFEEIGDTLNILIDTLMDDDKSKKRVQRVIDDIKLVAKDYPIDITVEGHYELNGSCINR